MQSLILTLHIIVCVLLVILILLQSGKEGMGVIFGGGNTSVFGSTGAGGILVKLTTFMAVVFVVTSLSYTYITSSHHEKESTILNVQIEDVKPSEPAPAAVTPAPAKDGSQVAPATPTQAPEAKPEAKTEAKPTEAKSEAANSDQAKVQAPAKDAKAEQVKGKDQAKKDGAKKEAESKTNKSKE